MSWRKRIAVAAGLVGMLLTGWRTSAQAQRTPVARPPQNPDHEWICPGVPDPRGQPTSPSPPRRPSDHWAFRPVGKPIAPLVRQQTWIQTPFDRYILAGLEAQQLRPAPRAAPEVLLRRACFDLTGLPPTAEEVKAFRADPSPAAYAQAVDRWLASVHFGEHWGRRWLRLVGYADLGRHEAVYPNAWRYRNYVINAFNQDKPFDQFVDEQLAGDLLPTKDPAAKRENLVATGFLVVGNESVLEPRRPKLLQDISDEQVNLTTRVFLGLSVSCARCHDHKTEPISRRDYAALAGIFTSTSTLAEGVEGGMAGGPRWLERSLATPEQVRELNQYETRFAELRDQVRDAREVHLEFPGDIDSARLTGVVVDNLAAEIHGAWKESNYSTNFVDKNYLHDANAGKGQKWARFVPDLPQAGTYDVLVSYTPRPNRATNVPVTVTFKGGSKTVAVDQTLAPTVDKVFTRVGQFPFDAGTNGTVLISNQGTTGFVVVDAVRFVEATPGAPGKPADAPDPAAALGNYRQLERELLDLQGKRPVLPQATAVQDGRIRNERVPVGAAPDAKEQEVPRGFLSALGTPDSTLYAVTDEGSGRFELAHWIANPQNPLTARVAVDRIWQALTGQTLVAMTNDFGLTTDANAAPRLLDYLAWRFMDLGWSTKQLIREIVLSSAYQMSSAPSPEAARRDPANRLLSHMNQRELDPEVRRDAMLAASGRLDPTSTGEWLPPESAATPADAARVVQRASSRRSVYLPVIRDAPFPVDLSPKGSGARGSAGYPERID